jgi:hypothetical protein
MISRLADLGCVGGLGNIGVAGGGNGALKVVPFSDYPGSSSGMSALGKSVAAKRELSCRYRVPGLLVGDSRRHVNSWSHRHRRAGRI